jgi:branched-subunit amino acid transport protein
MTTLWLILITGGLLTFATRLSFIALMDRWQPPQWMRRALHYVPPAVLTAIIFPELFLRDSQVVLLNPRLLAGALAALIAWRTKSVLLTIGVGMAALWIIQIWL